MILAKVSFDYAQ